jgi:hypothetical protein
MGVSVSINASHISYGQTYWVEYECTYTPFDVCLTIQVDDSVTWRFKYIAENLTSAYGSVSFAVNPDEIAADMTAQGYPPASHRITGICVNVYPQDIGQILNGNYAETSMLTIDQPVSNCEPPSNPTLSASQTTGSVTLSWKAGGAGLNNPVTGYVITYQESANGSAWGEVVYLRTVSGTSAMVDAPSTDGYYRRFGVQTKGSAGDDYLSDVVWSGALKKISYTVCGKPTSPKVASTLSRSAVELSWGAGSAGTNNSVTGYDVEQQDCADGVSWPSVWQMAAGSPVLVNKLSVMTPDTPGYFRRFRVRTRGSAGSDYYSGWVVSENTLRRKWNAFGAWTDPILTAGVSGIRAVHLTQLQERVNAIRPYYGLGAYRFTTVTARKTKISKWAALIQEIRNAIDEIGEKHDAWNALQAGWPRIAHIMQLRDIIDEGQGGTEAPYVFVIAGDGQLYCSSSTDEAPPFMINASGELIYTYADGTTPLSLYIDADGYLMMRTEG